MYYLIIILIAAACLLVISIIFMTVCVIKNSKKADKLEQMPISVPAVPKINTSDEHIKDFYDINSEKENKVATFDEFEGEENTFGADLKGFKSINEKNEFVKGNRTESEIKRFNSERDFSSNDIYDKFENDFKTVSIDEDNRRIIPDKFDAIDEFDETQAMDVLNPHISVVLKYKDGDSDKFIKMINPQVTVGRGIGNDLLLSHNSFTGRNHGVFTIKDNELYIKDLNSKNGTYINKTQRIEGEVLLEESCTVTFGDADVQVVIDREEGSVWK